MKIKDEKRLVEIIMRVWENGQYSQDLSTDLLVDGSFRYGQGAYKVDSVDEVIDYAFDWQNCTGDFVDDEDPDNNRRVDVDVTKKKPPVSVQHLPLLNSSSHLPGKVRAGRKKFYAND